MLYCYLKYSESDIKAAVVIKIMVEGNSVVLKVAKFEGKKVTESNKSKQRSKAF